ncbi:MAG: TetR family transcriptional regulator [Nocardioidaceae bacterium]|nr:TetR family transcriptional regulator [Nocardioidaceae bacterium]
MTQLTPRHRLVRAAVEAFAEKGFHATTTRDIASRAGMSPAALYVHHPSKEGLLYELSRDGHLAALDVVRRAVDGSDVPAERLRRLVHDFTRWHAEHSLTGRIVQYELTALAPEHLAEVAGYRRDIEATAREVLEDGVARGAFSVDDVPGTALAVLSLGVDLVRWYLPDGPRTPESVADLYAALALRMVAA